MWNGDSVRIQAGIQSVLATTSGAAGTADVVFPTPFAAVPVVTLACFDGSPAGNEFGHSAITTTGFTLHVTAATAVSIGIHWIAVLP